MHIHSRSVLVSSAVAAAGFAGLAVAGVSTASTARPAAAGPPKTVNGSLVTRNPQTLAPGTRVKASAVVGNRVFVRANDGFALVSTGQAQYPAATTDGGKTWKTDGPALHLDAAQAPLSVVDIGATGLKTIFAYGSGQAVDVTGDGGKHWYRALFQGTAMAVVGGVGRQLVAFVDTGSATWQYVSTNAGRSWRYDKSLL